EFADRFGTGGSLGDLEGPPPWNGGRSHHAALSEAVAAQGSRLHLVGIGGDELFGAVPSYLWSLSRRRPLRSLPTLRRSRLMNRWRLGQFLRELTDQRSFATWLGAQADGLSRPAPGISDMSFGWAPEPRLPAWAGPDAIATVRRLLRAAAGERPDPQAPDRYRHQVIDCAQVSGRALRQLNQGLAGYGVDWAAPFLDDAVIRAALSVRIEDRMARSRYKPVLTAAMRGVVPDEILARRSKGEFSAEAFDGLRRNRNALIDQCDDLRLARIGLVDAGRLRAALLAQGPETRHLIPFESTLSTETWLRARSATHDPYVTGG
ncbi:asparagine synthase-related protein, partial [Actinoplanes sp. NPDC049596]